MSSLSNISGLISDWRHATSQQESIVKLGLNIESALAWLLVAVFTRLWLLSALVASLGNVSLLYMPGKQAKPADELTAFHEHQRRAYDQQWLLPISKLASKHVLQLSMKRQCVLEISHALRSRLSKDATS